MPNSLSSLFWSLITGKRDFYTEKSMHLVTCNDTISEHRRPLQYVPVQDKVSRTLDSVTWILSSASRLHDWVGVPDTELSLPIQMLQDTGRGVNTGVYFTDTDM